MTKQGIFITGTDTGVGKTFIAAGIASILRQRGAGVGVMKPIHTGCKIRNGLLYPEDTVRLLKAAMTSDSIDTVSPYMFREPVAPYTACLNNNTRIDMNRIVRSFKLLMRSHDFLIVEGIGGVLVPITRNIYVADLIKKLGLPALVVARPSLGTINHTLLTINCLKERGVIINGIIINYTARRDYSLAEKTSPDIIKSLSGIPILAAIPYHRDKTASQAHHFENIADRIFKPAY